MGQRYAKVSSDSHVDGQLEAGRLFYRQIGGLSATGDRLDVVGCLAVDVVEFDAVAQKRTSQTSIVNLSPLQPVIVRFGVSIARRRCWLAPARSVFDASPVCGRYTFRLSRQPGRQLGKTTPC